MARRWWVAAEDGRQATCLDMRQDIRPLGTCVQFEMGIRSDGGRRLAHRLMLRCYDNDVITLAIEPPGRVNGQFQPARPTPHASGHADGEPDRGA